MEQQLTAFYFPGQALELVAYMMLKLVVGCSSLNGYFAMKLSEAT